MRKHIYTVRERKKERDGRDVYQETTQKRPSREARIEPMTLRRRGRLLPLEIRDRPRPFGLLKPNTSVSNRPAL